MWLVRPPILPSKQMWLVRPPILPSKQMWRFIRWSDHQYKAWDIGGFCKSATGGTDHAGPTWGFIGVSGHAGPTWGLNGGSGCLLWRPTQLYLGGVRGGGGGWAGKKEALLPSKQFWRFIRWSDHQYKAWDIGGFCKSATSGTDHAGPTWGLLVGLTTPVRRGGLLVGPMWGFIGGSAPNFQHVIFVVFANRSPVGPTRPVRRWGLEGPPTPEQYTVKAHPVLFGGQGRGSQKKEGTITQQTILKVYNLVRPPI